MSGIRDHCVYEFDVTYTQHFYVRNEDGDAVGGLQKAPGTRETVRVVAPKDQELMAEAWVRSRFRFAGDSVVLDKPRKLQLDGLIEEHIW